MHQRATLQAREHRGVDLFRQVLLVGQDDAAARPAQGLVGGGRHHMGVRKRAWVHAARHQAGEMRHVDHQIGADLVGNLPEPLEIDEPRIGRAARDDHLGPLLAGELADFVYIDPVVVAAHIVGHHLEPFSRHVDRRAVGKMPAGRQVQPHEGVARLHQGHEDGRVRRCPGVRLDIREAASKQLGDALNRQILRDIHELAAPVITPPRQPFRILVGQHRALGFQHGPADDVLGRNQFDFVALAAQFEADGVGDFRIGLGQRRGEEGVGGGLRRIWLLH